MFHYKSIFITMAISCATLNLSGCGGGGGDNSNDGGSITNDSQTESKITADNAEYYAAVAFASVSAAQGLPVGFGAPVSRTGSDTSSGFVYSDFAIEQFQTRKALNQIAARPSAGKPLDCQLHVVGDVAEEVSFVVGDHLTFDFNMCTYDTDTVVNDVISVTVTHAVGESFGPPPYEVGFDVSLVDLKVTSGGSDNVANGVMDILISDSGSGEINNRFSGNSLSVDMGSGLFNYTLNLNDYEINLTERGGGDFATSLQGAVQMTIPFANVDVTFTTITPFTGNVNVSEGNPTAGQLQLTGQNGTRAWVTAQPDGINVEIGLALFGGSTPDTTVMTTWSELERIVLMDIDLSNGLGF